MKMIKKISRIAYLICLCFLLSGCALFHNKGDDSETKFEYQMVKEMISQPVELNDRQKEILESEGLSTNYNSLNDEQKESIIKIEMLLTYLEDKYGEEFKYVKYYVDYEGILIARALDDGKCRQFNVLNDDVDFENF